LDDDDGEKIGEEQKETKRLPSSSSPTTTTQVKTPGTTQVVNLDDFSEGVERKKT